MVSSYTLEATSTFASTGVLEGADSRSGIEIGPGPCQ